ncbi:glycoside hydrolase family 28 protein [Mucilaginibacter robiniae]|uniref:Glycoside hydrolase family 28 protein n=1 Tax=Mucilaginibacter robiniae TaxID=2728022 RepID=A0A7L5E1A2_9SPHI|nr:glycoside hydrolase family 28 protein [Mucilaginibacter robiniae]QJD94603.1 glycoside hydrolase family 28 protein [Mucilaginibacter robiniae]
MKLSLKHLALTGALVLAHFFKAAAQDGTVPDMNYYLTHAPFKMPALTEPHFNGKTYNIQDYGAVSNGEYLNTEAIRKAITACSAAGGGTVHIPPGLWLTGPIVLQSNVNLHADRGALIIFSPDHAIYPILADNKVQRLISGNNLENVGLTGEGIYDGSGDTWRPLKKSKAAPALWNDLTKSGGVVSTDGSMYWPTKEGLEGEAYVKGLKGKPNLKPDDYLPARDFLRPNLVVISNSKNVLIDGPTFKNSPMFALNPNNCNNLIIRNVTINNEYYAQNGDGIDLSACKNAVIYHCTVNAGDDGICMKSSTNKNANADEAGLQNVVIADCIVYHAHGGFVIGSNTDGGMNNVYVTNCNYVNTDIGIRVKSNRGRGGLVHNIYIDNVFMHDILNEAILFSTYYEDNGTNQNKVVPVTNLTPKFQDFYISHVYCNNAKTAISITGLPEMPVNHINLSDVVISAQQPIVATEASEIVLKNVKIISPEKTLMKLDNSQNITADNIQYSNETTTLVAATGTKTSNIKISNSNAKKLSKPVQLGTGVDKSTVHIL